ncbi:hypothetical protein ACF0H5_022126 [Mactra antiquata]
MTVLSFCKSCMLQRVPAYTIFSAGLKHKTMFRILTKSNKVLCQIPAYFSRIHSSQGRHFHLSSSAVLYQRQNLDIDLPQVQVPEQRKEESDLLTFRGMDTDFPCLTRNKVSGPEPQYDKISSGYKTFTTDGPFKLKYNKAVLPKLTVAYETWGKLNKDKSNAVIIHAGLSASSHARSHADNKNPGWWEKFVGPGKAVDTDEFFVICTNSVGGCYGTSDMLRHFQLLV